MERARIEYETVGRLSRGFEQRFLQRMCEKGDHAAASRHEVLGAVTEEFLELAEAVRSKPDAEVDRELWDVIVACAWGLASEREW